MRADVAIVGLGAMGSAALAHCAQRGATAVGIERFERLHANGSSSGESRIIRKAYFEDAAYVPLLERAYELWAQLEAVAGITLLDSIGLLTIGEPTLPGIAGTMRTAQTYDLPLETLDARALRHTYPGISVRSGEVGVLERCAGMLLAEAAVDAHLRLAADAGGQARFGVRLDRWERNDGVHRLHLDDATVVEAARIICCPGMWAPELLDGKRFPLRVQRNVQIWFTCADERFARGSFPAFFVERADLPATLYGFPAFGGTLKAALHRYGETTGARQLDRSIRDSDVAAVRGALDGWIPGGFGAFDRAKVCAYTLTPDGNFLLGFHPDDPSVVVAAGFSGHGFKFAPVVGEIASDLALQDSTRFDIAFLRPDRFDRSTA